MTATSKVAASSTNSSHPHATTDNPLRATARLSTSASSAGFTAISTRLSPVTESMNEGNDTMQPSVIDRMDELAVHAALLIVEDHSLTAQGLAFALTQERYPVSIVTGAALRTQLARGWRADSPTIALLDLQLDVGLSGIDFIGPLTDAGAVVIMLTGITDPIRLAECLEAGAVALASKTGSLDGLLRTISDVERGFPAIESDERARLIDDLHAHRAEEAERLGPFARLTPRERDVLAAIVDGRKAEDIAAASYVSITTVRSQIYSVKQKLGATSQVAAIAMARRAGWTHD